MYMDAGRKGHTAEPGDARRSPRFLPTAVGGRGPSQLSVGNGTCLEQLNWGADLCLNWPVGSIGVCPQSEIENKGPAPPRGNGSLQTRRKTDAPFLC